MFLGIPFNHGLISYRAPLSFFASTDTDSILNRYMAFTTTDHARMLIETYRFSQDISLTSMTLPTSLLSSGIGKIDASC